MLEHLTTYANNIHMFIDTSRVYFIYDSSAFVPAKYFNIDYFSLTDICN